MTTIKSTSLRLLMLLQLVWLVHSSLNGWTISSYPNPQRDVDRCGRGGRPSWICDPDHILTTREADEIEEQIENLREKTAPCMCYDDDDDDDHCPYDYGGIQPAVAIVDKMYFRHSSSQNEKYEAAEDFAETLRDDYWEFGRCNDDFVIFLSRDDRQIYTAVGEEARSVLSDLCADTIYDENKKILSQGDYGLAIKNMVIDYSQVFQFKHTCQGTKSNEMYGIIAGVIILFVLVACVAAVWRKRKGGGGGDSSKSDYAPGHAAHYSTDHHSDHGSRKDSASSLESGGAGGGF